MARFPGFEELFQGPHVDRGFIVLCVRRYLRFKPGSRDVADMMAERGLSMAHTTRKRWVHRDAPESGRRRKRFALPAGASWRAAETYVKVPR